MKTLSTILISWLNCTYTFICVQCILVHSLGEMGVSRRYIFNEWMVGFVQTATPTGNAFVLSSITKVANRSRCICFVIQNVCPGNAQDLSWSQSAVTWCTPPLNLRQNWERKKMSFWRQSSGLYQRIVIRQHLFL